MEIAERYPAIWRAIVRAATFAKVSLAAMVARVEAGEIAWLSWILTSETAEHQIRREREAYEQFARQQQKRPR